MNAGEFAKMRGVSRSTLYRRAKEAGLDLAALRGEDGSLTDEALTALASVLDGTRKRADTSQDSDKAPDTPENGARSVAAVRQVEELQRKCETLEAALEASQRELALTREALDRERVQADAWRQIAEQRLLPAPQARQGFFARVRALIAGSSKGGETKN